MIYPRSAGIYHAQLCIGKILEWCYTGTHKRPIPHIPAQAVVPLIPVRTAQPVYFQK